MAKTRIDQLLVNRGLAETRARAQALILAGSVYVGGERVDKAGTTVKDDAAIDVRGAWPAVGLTCGSLPTSWNACLACV